jgi:molybdopterin-guanine dinucleotide biosynthesis protein B
MVAFEELARPALRKMMGHRVTARPVLTARLAAPLQVRPGRRLYLWAPATAEHGQIIVTPLCGQGTATVRSISEANALISIDEHTASLARGDRVRMQLLADLGPGEAGAVPMIAVVVAKAAVKATLLERLIPELQRRGVRVAVIKHDVHGFVIDREGTDTWRFARAGAEIAAISGPDRLAVVRRTDSGMPLPELADLMVGVDLILVKGYSQEPIPKIEVRRSGVVSDRPAPVGPIFAVVADDDQDPAAVGWDRIPHLADRIQRELLNR